MNRPLILVGAGTHAKMLVDILCLTGREILFATDGNPDKHGTTYRGIEVRGGDEVVLDMDPQTVRLVNGVGSVASPHVRQALFERFAERGFVFESIIHPSAVIAESVTLGQGVQVMACAVIQPDAQLEDNVLINTNATVDHDCHIGAHSHIAPGATISGGVRIGSGCHIGSGASTVQYINIGDGTVVGAGAVVIGDLPEGVTAVGVPARPLRK